LSSLASSGCVEVVSDEFAERGIEHRDAAEFVEGLLLDLGDALMGDAAEGRELLQGHASAGHGVTAGDGQPEVDPPAPAGSAAFTLCGA